jgi:hypothetical protein
MLCNRAHFKLNFVKCIRNAYKILVGKPEGKRQLGRPRRRWDDNIQTDIKETGHEVLVRLV